MDHANISTLYGVAEVDEKKIQICQMDENMFVVDEHRLNGRMIGPTVCNPPQCMVISV